MTQSSTINYNRNLHETFAPEIERLKKVETIANEILIKLETLVDIDPCGLDRCHLINAIQRILSEKTNLKNCQL